ncbi:MAG: AAA family ATPase [Clostridiaceae bacterium]
MGIEEHFLFYLYWTFSRIDKDSVILIEEPETFISISSQQCLMNHIAYKASEMGLAIVITTHSPFIIKQVKREHINIISRYGTNVYISRAELEQSAFKILGLNNPFRGTFLLKILQQNYF